MGYDVMKIEKRDKVGVSNGAFELRASKTHRAQNARCSMSERFGDRASRSTETEKQLQKCPFWHTDLIYGTLIL